VLQRVTTYGDVERIAFAKLELFAQGTPLQSAEPAPLSKGKYDLRCWILSCRQCRSYAWLDLVSCKDRAWAAPNDVGLFAKYSPER